MSNLVLQKFVPSHVRKVFFENQELRIPGAIDPGVYHLSTENTNN